MRTIFYTILIVAVVILYRDDAAQRAARDAATKQMEDYAKQKNELENEVIQLSNTVHVTQDTSWFQQRLNRTPSLLSGSSDSP
jgi:hypothetical protein